MMIKDNFGGTNIFSVVLNNSSSMNGSVGDGNSSSNISNNDSSTIINNNTINDSMNNISNISQIDKNT